MYKPRNIPFASSGVSNTAFITMSAPGGAPSPAPRGGSMGPGANGGSMPMSQQQMSGQPVHSAPPPGPPPPQSGAMSQQNLNQIVSIISCLCTAGYALSRGIVIILPWSCFLRFGRLSSWESGDGGQLGPCRCQCLRTAARNAPIQREMGVRDMVHHEEVINLTKSPRETAFSKNSFSTQVCTSPASRTLRGESVSPLWQNFSSPTIFACRLSPSVRSPSAFACASHQP